MTMIQRLTAITACLLFATASTYAQKTARPNIIYILADDLGYGDLSCYGQQHFETPHLDRLAAEGMIFTQHYAGATVCAPSRSALMTGLHTGHTPVRGNREAQPEGQFPLPAGTFTLAEMMQEAGYVTGAFGKWGLGPPASEGDPNNQGVAHFYGYNCQRLAHNYYPEYLWDNQKKEHLEGNSGLDKVTYAPEKIHARAMQFLEDNRDTTFFLYYPMVIPHAELAAPAAYMDKHRGKYLPEKKFEGVDSGEQFRKGPYASQSESHAAFAAMINLLDDQVGELVARLRALGLEENTLILFTSDNGPHLEGGADPDYFDSNGMLKGYKRDLYEGGIRVPFIARWKGTIRAGSVSDHPSAFWDVMPTFADLLKVPLRGPTDGVSFLPTLLGRSRDQKKHASLYWEFHELGGRRALRQGEWKLVQYNVNATPPGAFELYNLKDDTGEQRDVATRYPGKVEIMKKAMDNARVPSPVFRFANEK